MSTTTTGTRLSLQEFLALPEEEPALEFEDGEVTQKASPKGRHSTLQGSLVEFINRAVRPKRIARGFTELRSTFANMSRVPDVSVYRWNRVPVDDQGRVADDFWEPPDIAIEIISPGQSPTRLPHRCLSFIRAGVRAAILINPPDESILVIRPNREDFLMRRGEVLDLTDIIPELRLNISALFDELLHDLGP